MQTRYFSPVFFSGNFSNCRVSTRPTLVDSFQFVILSFVGVGNSNKLLILIPIQLRPQCGRNGIDSIKLATTFRLAYTKSASILWLYLIGKVLYKISSVFGTFFSLLFLFNNTLSYCPVHLYSAEVNSAYGIGAGSIDDSL